MAEDEAPKLLNSSQIDSNTNIRLTSILFNGKNYLPWKRAVTISLKGKGKFGHVSGTSKKPDKDSEEWEMQDNLIMAWLLNSMEAVYSELFVYCESAHEIWQKMEKMYAKNNNYAHIFQIQQDIRQIHQGTRNVTEFYGAMKAKWDELDVHLPETTEIEKIRERKEQDRVFQLLANLDSSFEQVRTQILLSPTLPSLDGVIAILAQEESRRKAMNIDQQPVDAQAMAVKRFPPKSDSNPKSEKGGDRKSRCEHCKMTNHTGERCSFRYPHLRPKKSGGGKEDARTRSASVAVSQESSESGEKEDGGATIVRNDRIASTATVQ